MAAAASFSKTSFLYIGCFLIAAGAALARAEDLPPVAPKVCNGYLRYPGAGSWGQTINGKCPPEYAVYAAYNIAGPRTGPPERITMFESCCPLPAPDVLGEETAEVIDRCPPDFVATAADSRFRGNMREVKGKPIFRLQCTKINTTRYHLGPPQGGLYWGLGSTYWKQALSIFPSEIPHGIRHGVQLYDEYDRVLQGCVGFPFGSLLVAKTGKRCVEVLFSELRFNGLDGDPPAGTPVPMFPRCSDITNIFTPEPTCVAP